MFAQPWAWLGLAGLAVPIAVHLLSRQQAVRVPFPSLQFIDPSDLNAVSRRNLTDIPLLIVRLLIIAAVVAAIAGPRLGHAGAAAVTTIRVIDGATTDAPAAVAEGAQAASAVPASIDAASLRAGVDAASAALAQADGARQITLVSRFPRGAWTDADSARVPADIGLRFERAPTSAPPLPAGMIAGSDAAASTHMTWPARTAAASPVFSVLAGPQQADADAALSAALLVEAVPDVPARVAFVWPSAPEAARWATSLEPLNEPWMFDAVAPIVSDASAAHVRVGSEAGRLIVLLDGAPSDRVSVSSIAAVARALGHLDSNERREPEQISDQQLTAWTRTPADAARRAGEPWSRPFWAAALGLLVLETWMRRRAG